MKILMFTFLLISSIILNAQDTLSLFNGPNLSQWDAYNLEKGRTNEASSIFLVELGMVRMFGSNAGYLVTKQEYSNFKLVVEYRWNLDTSVVRKSDKMNSGLMYLVPVDAKDTLWPKGIQFQIKQGATGDFILLQEVVLTVNDSLTIPGGSVKVQRLKDAELEFGEWNRIEVTYQNDTLKQYLNGELVNTGNNPSVKSGRILLQYEGFPIDFRKIQIITF